MELRPLEAAGLVVAGALLAALPLGALLVTDDRAASTNLENDLTREQRRTARAEANVADLQDVLDRCYQHALAVTEDRPTLRTTEDACLPNP